MTKRKSGHKGSMFFAAASLAALAYAGNASAQEAKPLAGYEKGFYIRDDKGLFELVVNARVQGRFAFTSAEAHETDTDGAALSATSREETEQFSVPQARLKLSGHVFSERVGYQVQADFGNKGQPALITAYGDFALVPGALHLRAGEWERPFSRQQITSSGSFHLVDRAITDKAFGAGRDLGVALHNDYEKSPKLEWALGVFNGTGDKPWFVGDVSSTVNADGTVTSTASSKSSFTNVPDELKPAVVGRLGFNVGGIKGYSEGDLEGGPLRLAVAASAQASFDNDDTGAAGTRADVDFILKAHGFSLDGAVYVAAAEKEGGSGFADQEYAAWGLHAQAGYVFAGHVEPVVRYALVDLDGDDNDTQELLGGVAAYFFKHNVKWITEAGPVLREDAAGDLTDFVLRTQVQLGF
jgi:phosphate-selective porin OprO and OprP